MRLAECNVAPIPRSQHLMAACKYLFNLIRYEMVPMNVVDIPVVPLEPQNSHA